MSWYGEQVTINYFTVIYRNEQWNLWECCEWVYMVNENQLTTSLYVTEAYI